MKPTLPASLAIGLLLAAQNSRSEEPSKDMGTLTPVADMISLELAAGNVARDQSVVVLPNPKYAKNGSVVIYTDEGDKFRTSGQFSEDGTLTFLSPPLKPGQKMRLSIYPLLGGNIGDHATAKKQGDQVQFMVREHPVLSYQGATRKDTPAGLDSLFLRGGYLHPLITPSGKVVTDDYPKNHLHHHGVWMAWTKAVVDGRETDFWNMGQGKGKVDFVSLEKTWSGPVEAGLIAKHKYTDLTSGSPLDVLGDTWTVKTYAVGDAYRMIDLESEQVTLNGKTLELPIYHYGGIGIRGLEAWNGKGDAATFTTSENVTDRIKANGQPARWIRMTGKVEGGGVAGIAILSHPDNFRSPQPVRIHPNEPFISFAPQTNGAMSIKPGETYKARYRFIVSDGEADTALLEKLWQDYAHPITAKWVK